MALDIMASFHRAVRAMVMRARRVQSGHPIPLFMGEMIVGLAKGAHHKYIRRVIIPNKFTKTGRPRYRYFYRTIGGKGLGHHDEMKVGAAFAMKDAGKAGHFEVTHDHGDGHVTIKHDETGTEHKIHKDALASMLHNEHAEVRAKDAENARAKAEKAKARAVKELGEAKQSGSAKQIARAKDEAAKHGHREPEPEKADVSKYRQCSIASTALENALDRAWPNGRDYYPQGDHAIGNAQKEAETTHAVASAIDTAIMSQLQMLRYGESHLDPDELAASDAKLKPINLTLHPSVHMNGSGGKALTEQYSAVVDAAKALVAHLDATPGMERQKAAAQSIADEYGHGLAVIAARAKGDVEPTKPKPGAQGEAKKAEAKSLHVPMKPNDQRADEREKEHEKATTDALKAIEESQVLPEVAKTIARNWIGRQSKGNARNQSDEDTYSMAEELAKTTKVRRDDRPPIIAEMRRIGQAYQDGGSSHDVRRMTHEAYEARQRHRDAVLEHVRKTVGPDTGAYVQGNQSLLGDIALGNIKDTAGLAAAMKTDGASRLAHGQNAIAHTNEQWSRPNALAGYSPPVAPPDRWAHEQAGETGYTAKAKRAAGELAALGHDAGPWNDVHDAAKRHIAVHEEWAGKREKAMAKQKEVQAAKDKIEAERRAKENAEARAARPAGLDDAKLADFAKVAAKASPLPSKAIDTRKMDIAPKPVDVKHLSQFTTKDETRKNLMGIHADGKMAVATDGHRLAMVPTTEKGHIEHAGGKEVERHALDEAEKDGLVYKAPGGNDSFPDYKQIFKKVDKSDASVHSFDAGTLRALAEAAVKRGKTMKAAGHESPVFLRIHRDDQGNVHAYIPDRENDTHKAPDIKVHGKTHKKPNATSLEHGNDTSMQASYLADALKGATGPVTLRIEDPFSPIDIHRGDGERHIVMPMRDN